MDPISIGALLGGIGQAAGGIGGLFNQGSSRVDNSSFYQNWRNDDMAFAREQFNYQKQLAESGIRMRVADAKAAGLHPLAALGASGTSITPISVGGGYSVDHGGSSRGSDIGSSLANMGQGIGRAVAATQSKEERMQSAYEMTVQRQQIASNDLDLQIKAAQLSRLTQQVGPGMHPAAAGHVMKPNEVTPSNPDGFSASGPATAGTQFATGPDGSRYATAPQGVNMDDAGSPGWLPFMYENHLLPFIRMATGYNKGGQDPAAPPLSQLPPGATGWHFAFPGRWVPTYPKAPYTGRGHLNRSQAPGDWRR